MERQSHHGNCCAYLLCDCCGLQGLSRAPAGRHLMRLAHRFGRQDWRIAGFVSMYSILVSSLLDSCLSLGMFQMWSWDPGFFCFRFWCFFWKRGCKFLDRLTPERDADSESIKFQSVELRLWFARWVSGMEKRLQCQGSHRFTFFHVRPLFVWIACGSRVEEVVCTKYPLLWRLLSQECFTLQHNHWHTCTHDQTCIYTQYSSIV